MNAILRTHVGLVRKVNEDAAYASAHLCVLCDGMGGHQGGDVASTLAVESITDDLLTKKPSTRGMLSAIANANEKILQRAAENHDLCGMGTTLTLLWTDARRVLLAQIGDSRAYLLRSGLLRQCTNDHSLVADLVRSGSITREEARTHPRRNLITRALGTQPRVTPDLFEFIRQTGDRWLLCSDGLTDQVRDEEIARFLARKTPDKAVDALLGLALVRGGADNITLLLAVDGEADT
jgi:protein phosphatase